ncbi:hypothetical protein TYRP_022170 [Tyrophagus putrescentiae]|nr:hypothetical protein TYRP_006708 [Tyrophagus putrescentiae]KAH9392145.1 hypothetical protein TYRP_022170 [Tyrophagus putrescentiae]
MKLFGQVFSLLLLLTIGLVMMSTSVSADYGCPITSKCKQHCLENKFKSGSCEGTLKLTCHCVG